MNVRIVVKTCRAFAFNPGKNGSGFEPTFQALAASFPITRWMPSVGASKLMRLLFRMIFWLTVVLVLLPSVGSQTTVERPRQCRRCGVGCQGNRHRPAIVLRASARSLHGGITGRRTRSDIVPRQGRRCSMSISPSTLARARAGARQVQEMAIPWRRPPAVLAGIPSSPRISHRLGADRVRARKLVSIGHRLSLAPDLRGSDRAAIGKDTSTHGSNRPATCSFRRPPFRPICTRMGPEASISGAWAARPTELHDD